MQIPNFPSLIVNSQIGMKHFVECDQAFIFPRKIITNVYGDFPDDETFKLYIYLCKHCRSQDDKKFKAGDVFVGEQKIMADLNLTNVEIKKAVGWLVKENFIEETGQKVGRAKLRRVLAAPDYNPDDGRFYSCSDVERTLWGLKSRNHGYILLPHDLASDNDPSTPYCLFSPMMLSKSTNRINRLKGKAPIWEQSNWDRRKLKILMLLYAHTWLRYFGGIDPEIVGIDSNGTLHIHESFCYDLKLNPHSVKTTICSFVNHGLVKPVQVVIGDIGYGERRFVCDLTSGYRPSIRDEIRVVLRPRFILAKQLDEYQLRGRMIL